MLSLKEDKFGDIFGIKGNERVLIVTVGNPLRSDDGVGPYIAEHIKPERRGFLFLNAEDKPANIIDDAVKLKPYKIIIIDAADFGANPGDIRIIPEDMIPQNTLSTHSFPIPVISSIIRQDTGAEIVFLGIQAKSLKLGEEMSREVHSAADRILEYINNQKKES